MLKLSAAIIFLFFSIISNAQYKWTGKVYTDPDIIPISRLSDEPFAFKGFKDKVRIYEKLTNENAAEFVIKELDLKTFSILRTDTIGFSTANFQFWDICTAKKWDVIVGLHRLLIYDRLAKDFKQYSSDTFNFSHGVLINDSTVLLSRLYNYHPLDGFSGLQLHIFNLNQNKIVKSQRYQVPGVGLGPMLTSLVFANKKNIFYLAPLTGELFVYDLQLALVKRTSVPVHFSNYSANAQWQKKIDSTIYSDWNFRHHLYYKIGEDSFRKNDALLHTYVDSREFLNEIMNTARSSHDYIEKIIPYTDSIFIITVCKANYNFKYRDLYFYNVNTNKVIDFKEKWLCSKNDPVTKFEDFFSVDVIFDSQVSPYFYNNKVYTFSTNNYMLYRSAPLDTLKKVMYKDALKNNYKWHLSEYQLQ
ncbi:hypothetical protein ACEN9X_09375 [Mucilaginibacter sp. Mucisp86]|uniref:hypothetical protein n=1 Tax=Mucilaginibacter sp. Mucisp86 TaxID=3243060 RepID=UPI0039B5B35F